MFEEYNDIDKEGDYLKSEQFRNRLNEQVKEENFIKGLIIIYMDDDYNIVERWSDGTFNILYDKEDLKKICTLKQI
jgi:hypothetical protein